MASKKPPKRERKKPKKPKVKPVNANAEDLLHHREKDQKRFTVEERAIWQKRGSDDEA